MFCKIIENCKLVIATDCDINSVSLEFLMKIKKNLVFVKNTYSHNLNVQAVEIETVSEIVEKLKTQKKFFCCTDSKSRAEKIFHELNDPTIKLITSDEIAYINLDLWDRVIVSPKIIYGLDCTIKKNVYAIYQTNTISPSQMLQQLTRIRNIGTLYYNFISKSVNEPLYSDLTDCYNTLLKSNRMSVKEFDLMCDKKMSDDYLNYLSKIEYTLDCFRTNKFYHFRNLLKKRGFKLVDQPFFKNQTINKKAEKEIVKKIFEKKVENIDFYKSQVNKYLNIPDDMIHEYSDMLIDKYKLLNHFNIKKMFFKYKMSNDIKLHIVTKDNDFGVNITSSSNSKIYFLKCLLDATKAVDVQPLQPLSADDSKKYYNKYKTIYRVRTKKELDFTNLNHIHMTVAKIYKDLFKNYVSVKKKGKNRKFYSFTINKDQFDYHSTLYNYSIRNNKTEFIEDEDEDEDDSIIKTLKIYN